MIILHSSLGIDKPTIQRNLGRLIRSGEITLGGYKKARIYGTLHCRSGKRMKIENRVFFKDEQQAITEKYRPCAHCLPGKYKLWKLNNDLKIVYNDNSHADSDLLARLLHK
ncbi:Ada metal-binding domain-containing protein [Dyadobacter sp. 3J3]|uniref:Ada metal-binding domain-containing protein n=1 Tax=Dyadobacter sp. 3J3 TaxID=2606600 RepID=UPI00135ABD24|nr:Ada metal-binding domain-containing protein [Dyadobacter sp. 3J3]